MPDSQDSVSDLDQGIGDNLLKIIALLCERPVPPACILQGELFENGAERPVSKALEQRFQRSIKEGTEAWITLGNDLESIFNQLLQMELELVLMSAQNHAYFLKHPTRRHPYTGTGARESAFSGRLYREESGKLVPYSIKILSYQNGLLEIEASSADSCQLVQQYLRDSLLISEASFNGQDTVLNIEIQPGQLLEKMEQQRINSYSVCVLNEEGSLVFPEFQKEEWDGTVRYTVSEGLCQDPYHPWQSLYSRLMHDFGIEIRDPRAENNFTRLKGTDGAVFLLEAEDWFLTGNAINKAKRSYLHRQDIPRAVFDYLRAEMERLQNIIRARGYKDAIVEIEFLKQEQAGLYELKKDKPRNYFGKITVKALDLTQEVQSLFNESGCRLYQKGELPKNSTPYKNNYLYIKNNDTRALYYVKPDGEYENANIVDFNLFETNINVIKKDKVFYLTSEQIKNSITANGGHSRNGIIITPQAEGFSIEGIEPAAFGRKLRNWGSDKDVLKDNAYFGGLNLPNDTPFYLYLDELTKDLGKEPLEKRNVIVDETRKILGECTAFLESSDKSPEKVASFIEKVKNYESELLHLSVKQKLLLTACSVIGTALGVVIGAALGLAVGALFYGGIASVAPVFGTVAGAISGGSITGILLAIKGAGVGAMIGTAAGAFLGGLSLGGGSTHLVHRGFFSDSQRTVKKIANELIELLQRNQENTAETSNSEKPEL